MVAQSPFVRCLAEFVGTFFLVLVTGCSVLNGYWAAGPVPAACALVAVTYATIGVSGGHLNPAVSLASGFAGRMPFADVAAYCVSQIAGALCAAESYTSLYSRTFTLGPRQGYEAKEAGVVELLYTFMLCLVFLNCDAQHGRGAEFTGAAVGLVLIASTVSAGTISGGCLNPAGALAFDMAGSALKFGACYSYIAFQLLGAAIAGGLYKVLRPPLRGGAGPAIAAEFVGTFLLAFTITFGALSSTAEVWASAAALAALAFALGDVSGAHLNPAVTLTVVASENVHKRTSNGEAGQRFARAVIVVIVQFLSASVAAVVALAIHDWKVLGLRPGIKEWSKQGLVEISCTCLLVFTVLATSSDRAREPLKQHAGLAIGLSMLAGGNASHELAGGTMNPALTASIGIAGAYNLGGALRLVGFQLIGAGVGGTMLQLTHPPARAPEGQPLLPPLNSLAKL